MHWGFSMSFSILILILLLVLFGFSKSQLRRPKFSSNFKFSIFNFQISIPPFLQAEALV